MNDYVLTDIGILAPPSTQYEVTNWLFGRGHVAPASASRSPKESRLRKQSHEGSGTRYSGEAVVGSRPRPRRRSSYSESFKKERQETATLRKSHRRARSDGQHLSRTSGDAQGELQDGLQKAVHVEEEDAAAAGHQRHSRVSKHRRTSSQRSGHRFSFWKGQRDSVASSAVSGDTLVGSTEEDIEGYSPTCLRFSAGSYSKHTPHLPSPSLTCKVSPAAKLPTPLPKASPSPTCPTNLTVPTSPFHPPKTRFDRRSVQSTTSPGLLASTDLTMDEKSRINKALDAFKFAGSNGNEEDCRQDDQETDDGNFGHRLKKQRSLAQIGRRLHLGRNGAPPHGTQLLHSPTDSSRRRASFHKTSYMSLEQANVLPHDNHSSHRPSSQANHNTGVATGQDADELDPALLGSFDYHKFLSGGSSRNTASTTSPYSTAQPAMSMPSHSSEIHTADLDHNKAQFASCSTTASPHACPVLPQTNQQTVQQNLKAKRSLPLLERRTQRLQEQFADTAGLAITIPPPRPSLAAQRPQNSPGVQEARPKRSADRSARENASRATPIRNAFSQLKDSFTTPDTSAETTNSIASIPVLIGCSPFPSRSASQQRLPRTPRHATVPSVLISSPPPSPDKSQTPKSLISSVDPAMAPNPLSGVGQDSPTTGPVGTISYKEIDPERLKPFIGPLTKQQPPPNKPLPHPPVGSTRRFNTSNGCRAKAEDTMGSVLKTNPSVPVESTMSPMQNVQSIEDKSLTANSTSGSIETKVRPTSFRDKRTLLRNKVSTLFGEANGATPASRAVDDDQSVTSTPSYRPISMNSLDTGDNTFSEIFDDVFNTARDSAHETQRSTCPSFSSGRPSMSVLSEEPVAAETAPRTSISARTATQPTSRIKVAERLATRLGITDSASRKAILEALVEVSPIVPPPLTDHPAIRGDLPLQARLGMITDSTYDLSRSGSRGSTVHGDHTAALNPPHTVNAAAMPSLHVLPLNVSRQRPTQVAVSTRHASRSTVATLEPLTGFTTRSLVAAPTLTSAQDDIDPSPAFDRSVDMTWYRYAKDAGRGVRESSLPYLPAQFDALSTVFMVKYSRGRQSKTTAYDHLRRFAYFELDGPLRFKIMEELLEDCLPGKTVLLNHSRQAAPAWAEDAFATLWEALGPLQNAIWACPRLRADVMAALFMLQPFHVIFSPFVKPITQPLPTKWLFKYLYFMQDVRVELDMTKLGFGHVWQATGLSTRLWDIGNLVHVFVEEVLKRDPRTNPMGQLTIHCRRFFGYRQGDNPHRGDVNFYEAPAGEDDEQKPGTHPAGQPWNYGRKTPSLPPSANNPYSGHRRHHTGGPERVPFLHEGHLSVANPFQKLTGRVCSVRMVGMSEKWSMDFLKFWPKSEHDKIPKENLGLHIDRYTPSRHTYVAPGHAIFLDYGIRAGVHRFPPLHDSEPMVCTVYDDENDIFLEVGSGNILTVKENGVEIIARSSNPPMPKSDLPIHGSSPISLEGITVPCSRIPGPVGTRISPTIQAMRKGTPSKVLQLLGPEAGDESMMTPIASPTMQGASDNDLVTPTASRVPSTVAHASRCLTSTKVDAEACQLSQLGSSRRRSSSTNNTPKAASVKNSYVGLMSGDRREPSN